MWTEAQKQVINRKSSNFIVSASAGSGKTTVLSQRVLEYIKNGGSIDRLIIATFTRAAASEMKSRIEKVLRETGLQTGDRRILTESLKVSSSRISTIDSFAIRILKENFLLADISPDFDIISENEFSDIKNRVLKNQIEEYYTTGKNNFAEYIKLFGESKENNIELIADELYSYILNLPFPLKWLDYQLNRFKDAQIAIDQCCDFIYNTLTIFMNDYIKIMDSVDITSEMYDFYNEKDLDPIRSMLLFLKAHNWGGFQNDVFNFDLVRAQNKTPEAIKEIRKDIKSFIKDSELFLISEREIREETEIMLPQLKAFFDFVKDYYLSIEKELKQLGRFHFSHISQMVLSFLVDDYDHETGKYELSSVARSIIDGVDEVMIDEYQDVNDVQELLFKVISDEGKKLFCVGDVKQSIYRFRGSNLHNFIRRTKQSDTLSLNTNFRSDPAILNFVNYIFKGIFTEEINGMRYDADQMLLPPEGSVPNPDSVELLLYDREKEISGAEAKAEAIYRYVKDLLYFNNTILDPKTKEERTIVPGDIAILVRDKALGNLIETKFKINEFVGVTSVQKNTFWNSVEVNVLIAFLNIIDNPYDDLSLTAVLLSDIFEFTADKVANIRLMNRKRPLYDCLNLYIEKNDDEQTRDFCSILERFYLLSKSYMPDVLLLNIIDQFKYLDKKAFSEDDVPVREQINMFYEYVCEKCKQPGMNLNMLTRLLKDGDSEILKQATDYSSKDMIKIMTIHESKGLEFPICILPSLDRRIDLKGRPPRPNNTIDAFSQNKKDRKCYIDSKMGVSALLRDSEMVYERATFQYCFQQMVEKTYNLNDELNLLYVAMTRAKSRLVMLFDATNFETKLDRLYSSSLPDTVFLNELIITSEPSLDNLILKRIVHIPNVNLNGEYVIGKKNINDMFSARKYWIGEEDSIENDIITIEEENPGLKKNSHYYRTTKSRIINTIKNSYSVKQKRIPAKIAVTEMVKQHEFDDTSESFIHNKITIRKPRFETDNTMTGTKRGTAIHKFMRYFDFSASPETELKRLREEEYLTDEEADVIPLDSIDSFKKSDLFSMIMSSKKIWKEKELMTKLPSTIYDKEAPNGSEIIVQGALDLLLEDDDGLTIIDYKTDAVEDINELKDRYQEQLKIYMMMASKCFEKPVKNMYIWSFSLSEMLEIR